MNSLWLSNNKLINNNFIKEIDTSNTSNKTLLETNVCIVGAGIFGLTCAYYLSNLGYRVTVLEKDKIGEKTTGHTAQSFEFFLKTIKSFSIPHFILDLLHK